MDLNGQHQIRSHTFAGIWPPTKSTVNSRWKKSKSKLGSLEAGFRGNSIYNAGVCQSDLSVGGKNFSEGFRKLLAKIFFFFFFLCQRLKNRFAMDYLQIRCSY